MKLECPSCLSDNAVIIGSKNEYDVRQCKKCRTIFSDVQIEKESDVRQVSEMYDNYYNLAKFELLPATEKSLQKTVESFETFRQTKKFLDIGFGEGGMLKIAQKNGWQCYGTEISPHSLKYGAEMGCIVTTNALEDKRFVPRGFDVVTMIELIEHVPAPDDFFHTAAQMLRPGGLLYLTTPNAMSLNRRFLGVKWSMVSPPEHITIWSLRGLDNVLKRTGFKLKAAKTEGFNPVEIVSALKSKKITIGGHERNEAAFALNETFTSSRSRQAVKLAINRGLNLFSIGDTLKIRAIRQK